LGRTLQLATTYLRKARDLYGEWPPGPARTDAYGSLLSELVYAANQIAAMLPDDFFLEDEDGFNWSADVKDEAMALLVTLDARRKPGEVQRRIENLENVDGRTPEEAALFRAKATELRSRRGH
jgi:hypothetical protein